MSTAYDYWNTRLAKANPEQRRVILAKMIKHVNETKQRENALRVNNAYEWITRNNFTNENGIPMEFADRDFMIQPLCDESKLLAVLKCSQVGFSTMSIFKACFHNAKYGHNIIYTLPTDSDVEEFNKAKTNMILDNNPTIKAQMIENSLHTKSFRTLSGDNVGFTFYKGTYGKSASIMQTADILIKDEFDRSNQGVLNAYKSRIKASAYAAEWEFSNPSFPSFGVDYTWQLSDQKHYFYWCPKCDHPSYITYEPESFDGGNTHHVCKERREYVCGACGDVLDRRTADKEWVPKYEDDRDGISGYWISQMMAPWISARELIRDEKLMLPDVFANFDLGRAYASNSNSLDPSNIIKNVQYDENGYIPKVTPGKFRCLGVDQGGTDDNPKLYCVKGTEEGIDEVIKLDSWEKLHNYMRMKNISMCVIDNAPKPEKAIELATAFPGKVWRCVFDYNDERKQLYEGDYKTRILNAHRTRIFDRVVDGYITGERKVFIDGLERSLSGMAPGNESLCIHWKAQRKVGGNGETPADREKNKHLKLDKQGNIRPMWVNEGADHFSLADIYNQLAQLVIKKQMEGA
ncbi:hypothetical protein QFZ77_002446 [Paenibacillus sp. V4I3]|uniref:phage terminase large subunit family protein n=1 Tax=Paenibacillus sp. V4I3 TaxID=3042305 RepID=UPI00278269D3|nr:phage terminase large subunit family protein [Paenibacillus sp. V4I3]MDQ0873787.1 hypothetical protein [Paenibacillus sp. V4I3]